MRRRRRTSPPIVEVSKILPAAGATRWGAREKAAVVLAVRSGVLERSEACARYMLSEEEFALWERAFAEGGVSGLQAKNLRRLSQGMDQSIKSKR